MGLFRSAFQTKISYAFLIFPTRSMDKHIYAHRIDFTTFSHSVQPRLKRAVISTTEHWAFQTGKIMYHILRDAHHKLEVGSPVYLLQHHVTHPTCTQPSMTK